MDEFLTGPELLQAIHQKPEFISPMGRGPNSLAEIARLSEAARGALLPWQALVAAGATERRSTAALEAASGIPGPWRWPLVTVTVPRQSGKTHLIGCLLLQRCISWPDQQCWYSAQSRSDALLRWREFVQLLDRMGLQRSMHSGPTWTAGDYKVRGAGGDEEIQFANGSSLRIFAPQEDSLHGSVTDLVVLDEVRFHDLPKGDALLAAVLPTQVTRNGQVWLVSTSGDGRSAFLARMVEQGRQAVDSVGAQQFHAEWAIPERVPDGELLAAVEQGHPAFGQLLRPEALRLAYDQMSALDFAREYGNRWVASALAADTAIDADVWSASCTQSFLPDGPPTFGVDVALDRGSAAIVACVGGLVEVIDVRPGAAWLVPRLRQLVASWPGCVLVVDGLGPAGTVAEALAPELGAALITTNTRQVTTACAAFHDALTAEPPQVLHREHPSLDEAAATAVQRRVGQSWAWSRTTPSGPVLMAATLAWWGCVAGPVSTEAPQIW